jgi:Ser/Thr protein kinase RdoA (MazF antagonist)
MEKYVTDIFSDKIKTEAAKLYGTRVENLKLLGDIENFVYSYPYDGKQRILRVTHSSHRTEAEIRGEIDWLNYLVDRGVPAARAYSSPQGNLAERVDVPDGSYFLVVSFEKAPGKLLGPGEWTPELIEEWGRIVAMTHRLTKDYPDPGDEIRREHWYEFDYLRWDHYIPADQLKVLEKCKTLVTRLMKLPMNRETYGLVHTDMHQSNLLVEGKKITVIDFDDAYHIWFAGDIATLLFYSRWLGGADVEMAEFVRFFLRNFWNGYEKENHLDDWWKETYHDFLKLREMVTYVFIYKKLDVATLDERGRAIMLRYRQNIENDVPLVDVDFRRI